MCVCICLACVRANVCPCVKLWVGMERKELISPSWHVNLSVIESFKSFPYFLSVKYFFASSPLPPTQFALGDSSKRCYSNFCPKGKAATKNKGTEGTWSKPGTCCCLSLKYFSFSVFECGGRKRSDVNGGGRGTNPWEYKNLRLPLFEPMYFPSTLSLERKTEQKASRD